MVNHARTAFETALLFKPAPHRIETLDHLESLSAALCAASDRTEIISTALQHLIVLLPARGAAFAFRDGDNGELVFEAGIGGFCHYSHVRVLPGKDVAVHVFDRGQFYTSQDNLLEISVPQTNEMRSSSTHTVFAPLKIQNQVMGAIVVSCRHAISKKQARLLRSISSMAANAIQRIVLQERLESRENEFESRVEERTLELRATNAVLAQADQSKGRVFASMSHELRAPLTNILSLTAVLREQVLGSLNEEQRNLLSTVEESGHHLLNLVNDILDASKMEAGQLRLSLDPCPVDMVCQSSLHLVNGMAEQRRQKVQYTISPQNLIIRADALRLKQMLVNLLSNAVKFTPEGGALGLEVTGDAQAGAIRFSVWDTGMGIPNEALPQLFQPFSQLTPGRLQAVPGTGLGLAIVQQLADLHGGGVSLESIPGKGSRFTIHIPVGMSSQELSTGDEISRRGNAPLSSSEGQSRPGLKKEPCILLADDNPLNLDCYARYLRQFHYRVYVSSNGREALELAYEHHPGLILIDTQMPEMDGVTAIQRLRADSDQSIARIPIIALTALAMPGDRERCLEAGADDYLCKPISLHQLLHLAKRHLGEVSLILNRHHAEDRDAGLKERCLETSCVPL